MEFDHAFSQSSEYAAVESIYPFSAAMNEWMTETLGAAVAVAEVFRGGEA